MQEAISDDVVVLGEALIDIVETEDGEVEHVGGSPANVALGLGRLGIPVSLLTHLADDERGRRIVAHVEESGARVLPASFSAERTSTARATIAADGQASYVFDVSWDLPVPAGDFSARVIHTGSIAAFLRPGAERVRDHLRAAGAREITFDPNIRPALLGARGDVLRTFDEVAALATVVKMSDEDASWLFSDADVESVLERVLALGPRLVAITRGGEGALLASRDAGVTVPVVRTAVVDTIGAGDTFMASLVASVVQGGSEDLDAAALAEIGRRAARAASITVSRAGADLPWKAELAD